MKIKNLPVIFVLTKSYDEQGNLIQYLNAIYNKINLFKFIISQILKQNS